ncbi:MocR-like pyridoxine biosynthesis transcription factor PdxR [Paraburkholderia fungorum]|uniref:GntR family transcriptional regulator/MocR family aminotransferase n=1 Tax=Paraburkholderia fungorum TaxID=134537 RepID=A0AAP1KSV0_9BURK|nr:PLP-dependent aminotransferase family protein [Paraburkholderia fungorum]MBB4512857.1 GntR family transcriptional regulator/MocR family aminotransferase [Paraburkholderia fungorum]MBB6201714.1 GntR family transcriptional regulator/MocR family aminotransferase [Paraburkholderia fungorum]MDT8839804.1 PLP-dependent aminotransferase family protein [Paraburkholderia fungorum]PRZ55289.1 GntR family transcriptional regulator [Paraburkholderia fungorum]USU18807.1 PLP-dependent aminotransferase fami
MDTVILSDWLAARLDRAAAEPVYRQTLRLMQQAILTGQMPPGTKLPSSRTLAEDLGIARNTVLHVYDQLTAEGYVISTTGSGTYVADTRPDAAAMNMRKKPVAASVDAAGANPADEALTPPARDLGDLSTRGRRLIDQAGVSAKQWGAFMPGVPDVAEFPARTWSRLQARLWKEANPDLLTYAPGGGYRPLRRALSDYLRVARSVNCTPDQIIITTGIHQSIDLAVRLLTDVGDRAWVEEPCYWGARSVLQSSGITLVPVPVDDEGLNPREQDLQQPPRLALVTPSHQYPLGMVMSLARRRTLLEYARQHNVWIIEDDYDSEFRYGSRPLASLQGLDDAGQVIYVGSLGKMLFPGLRIGYMIAPEHLVDTFRTGVAELYREGQLMQQAVMTDFIMDGHLTSHVRRMRALYGERRQILIDAITARFGNELPVMGDEAGLHLVLGLPDHANDRAVTAAAYDAGVIVRPLAAYYSSETPARRGLLLGYACVANEKIGPAFDTLARVIEQTVLQKKPTRAA